MTKGQIYKEVTRVLYSNFDNAEDIIGVLSPILQPKKKADYEQYAIRDRLGNLTHITCRLSGATLPKEEFPRSNVGVVDFIDGVPTRRIPECKEARSIRKRFIKEQERIATKLVQQLLKEDSDEIRAKIKANSEQEPDYSSIRGAEL